MKERTNRSAEAVNELRAKFLDEYQQHAELYDEKDADKLAKDDWYVKRFLLARRRNVAEALVMLKETMKWRREFEIPQMRDYHFPVEFYKSGGLFPYEKDKQGNVVVYMRICMHRKIPQLEEPVKKYLVHVFDKVDRITNGNGFALVFDLSNVGYSNVDWDFLKFLIHCGKSYFPVGLKYILVYNMPWVLNAIRKVAFALIPEELLGLIRFSSKDEVFNFIDKENLPDYMGGTCMRNYRAVPNGCESVSVLALHYGHSQEVVDTLMPVYEPILNEADQALAASQYVDPENFFDQFDPNDTVAARKGLNATVTQDENISSELLLKLYPDDTVDLCYDSLSCEVNGEVILQNLVNTPVAFKVLSNNSKKYTVSPRQGIILPNCALRLSIRLVGGSDSFAVGDKFLVLGLPVNYTKVNADEFKKLWSQNKTISYKLNSQLILDNSVTDSAGHDDNVLEQLKKLTLRYKRIQTNQRRLVILLSILIPLFIVVLGLLTVAAFDFDPVDIGQNLLNRNYLFGARSSHFPDG